MTRKFPKWVIGWTLTAIFITSFPYILGLVHTSPGMTFTGNLLSPADTFSYYADMQLGAHGYWLYRMPYSAQANHPVLLFSFYIALGHLSRLLHLSIALVYHLARAILGIIFALVSYRFQARYLHSEPERKLAFGFLLFTSGFGWLMLLIFGSGSSQWLRPDIWIFEANSFGSLAGFPHFILSVTLMMVMLMACQNIWESRKFSSVASGITAGLGIALIHPQQLIIVGAIAGLTALFHSWKNSHKLLQNLFWLFLIFFPALSLSAVLTLQTKTDPYLSNWMEQGNTYSPPPWSLLILFGPVLIFAIFGLVRKLSSRKWEDSQVLLWLLIVPFLLYIPVNFQRRFIEGWFIPVDILAAFGWYRVISPWLVKKIGQMNTRIIFVLLFLGVCCTPIFQVSGMIANAYLRTPFDFVHFSQEEKGAIEYLRANANCDDITLASYDTGNYLPAYVCLKSFVGHWSLTPFYAERLSDATEFYDPNSPDSQRVALIDQYNIRYIYLREAEGYQGNDFLDRVGYLKLVYRNSKISIYETQR
jgi:hypothetical protein